MYTKLAFPMYQELHAKNPYLDNHQPSEFWTHIQDYPKTYITRTQSTWYSCILNARHDWLSIPIRKGTTTMVSASKGSNNKRETSFWVYYTLVKAWRIRPENYPLLVNLGLQDLLSKLYFCGYKIRFAPSKVTCRLLPQRSDKSLFRFAKEDVLKENEPTKGNYSYKHTYYKHLGYPVVCFQLLQFIYSSNSAI